MSKFNDDYAMEDLKKTLDKVTEVATDAKMNADYVIPGMVTLLDARKMEVLGFQLVWDALSTVPGITNISNNVGELGTTVRGVGQAFGSSKTLYLINGHHTEALLRGKGSVELLPLALVDQIEVMRGPGGALYGGYAYNAVVNVVLKKANAVSLTVRNKRQNNGSILFKTPDAQAFQANGSISGRYLPSTNTLSGPDAMYQLGNAANSHAPGVINNKTNNSTFILDMNWHGFAFHTLHNRMYAQDNFGLGNMLSTPHKAGYFVFRHSNFDLDKTWRWQNQRLMVRLGHQRMNVFETTPVLAAGFTTVMPLPVVGNTIVPYPNGMVQQLHYTEQRKRVEVEWKMNTPQHHLLAGLTAASTSTRDAWFASNYDLATQLPFSLAQFSATGQQIALATQYYTGANNWIKEKIRRDEQSLFVQDEWLLNDDFTATIGMRADRFSDVAGVNLSPRLAGIYTVNDRHILKAQFATAFRPPTFLELYLTNSVGVISGNSKLKSETSKNIDVSYIFKDPNFMLRTSLYYAEMKNLIVSSFGGRYDNIGQANRKGIEFEYQFFPRSAIQLDGNLSYNLTKNKTTNKAIVGSSRWLANTHIQYNATRNFNIHLLSQYIGKRAREAVDTRQKAPSTVLSNIAMEYKDFLLHNLTATLGVKNIFDRPVVYPSTTTRNPNTGQSIQTYPNDYPQNGRTGWLNVSYDF